MATDAEVQEKFYNEIQSVCGRRPLEFKDVSDLIFGLCIMYETMRLFPVLGTLPRRPEQDELLLRKLWIPKGASIGPDLVSLHRNERYWGPTCNEFNPSRFDNRYTDSQGWHPIMDGKLKIPAKGAFIPFGEGPRNCLGSFKLLPKADLNIGRRFAEIEFVTCLALVVQKWHIRLAEGWTKAQVWNILDASVQYATIRPSSNIPIVLEKR